MRRAVADPFAYAEAILPELGADAVRLPRHQSGNSPQGMTVTMVADYTLRDRTSLPSGALVELLTELGNSPSGARTTINRLVRRGVLESERRGRQASYRLSVPASGSLARGGRRIAGFAADAESWDGRWTLITFSLPQQGDAQRRALRARLRWHGYAPLYDALWVSPKGLTERVTDVLAEMGHGTVTAFRSEQLPLPGVPGRNPLDAWDLDAIAELYGAFLRRWLPIVGSVSAGEIRDSEAVRTRTEVMGTYRHFSLIDPDLPLSVMPPGWPRTRARELFVALYDGLAGPALDHVRHVVAHHLDGPRPDIRTHSVAELLAGIPPANAPY